LNKPRDTTAHGSALFPPREERRDWEDFLTRELGLASARVDAGSVTPTFDLARFRHELAAFDFQAPRAMADVVPWTITQLEHGLVHVTHPRYFGLYNPAPTFPAQCGDRIAATFNPQLATSTTSPAAVDIEAHVIRAVAQRAGLPEESVGHFTSGGSEANCTAVICALTHAHPGFASEGARAIGGAPTFYVSRESHLAWVKIAHQVGIGRSGVRLVATDGTGRMDANALEQAVRADKARGCVPFMIAATAGTSNAGMVDPLVPCAAIARAHGLWYHVDAAWGGALIASERLRGALEGIEQADSTTIDAHKWFATTMGCGMYLTRHARVLADAFHVSVTFMPSSHAGIDPYVTTMQWSRRFLGLRLFLSLAAAGWVGYARHVERAVELIAVLRDRLVGLGWRIANDSPLAVLCVDAPRGSVDARRLASRVLASGRAWVAAPQLEGRDVIRICVTHGEVTPADIDELVGALQDAR